MQRSIAAVSLGGGLQEKLYAVAAAGFTLVELTESDVILSDMLPGDIRLLLDETGLSVSAFHAMSDIEALPDAAFRRTLESIERKFELMRELGAELLLISASSSPDAVDDDELAARHLHDVAGRAARHGMRIAYEASVSARHVRNTSHAWKIVQRANHSALGLVVDSFESLAGDHPGSLEEIPGARIFLVQLADAPSLQLDAPTLGRHFRCFPGQGALELSGFVAELIDSGYSGPFSLEILNAEIRALPVRQAALDAMRSLTFVEEQVHGSGRSSPGSVFASADPPAHAADEAIGFIEFAVNADSRRELGRWLEMLGYQSAGQHHSKDVHLYRQGDVFVVLNAVGDTFAHYYHHLHGTSVCAIGLHVSNPSEVLERVGLYRYKLYRERHGINEYDMPAVRSPDGSLVHILGKDYSPAQDFAITDVSPTSTVGLRRVDHVGRAVPSGQMGAWVLFLRTVLGLQVDRPLAIPDPHGTVSSTALTDRSHRIRFPLTSSDNSSTVVAKVLSNFGGAGVNQIAFETDDIFASIAAIRANGMPLLEIPANYYSNLETAKGLSRSMIERLAEANVLYDSDGNGGEFFHAYTDFFGGRFFFEIVQRSGGYDRYGEANSAVRLAVQAKHKINRGQSRC
jgi:4-hydroxyphenylpyruvate dioxygenase